MSTFLGQKPSKVLHSEEDLTHYFEAFAKPAAAAKVGIEVELFAVHQDTGHALPYEGPLSIHAILKQLAGGFGYEPIFEEGRIIALKRADHWVTLEPGGQVELSAPPAWDIFEVELQVEAFLEELRQVRRQMPGLAWLATGMQPFSALEDITWVPKQRYAIMADHMNERGSQSHEMMKRTATNQVNLDYVNEEQAMASMRVVLGITSIVSAMFANSCFSEGVPNGFRTRRLDIWNHTDPDRTGLLATFVRKGTKFQHYIDYLLDMPMMFIVRDNQWIRMNGLSFRHFIRDGFEGAQATLSDFELHLSTAFPEARFKQYLEIRGADGQKPSLIPAVPAFWKGILYDEGTREAAWALVADIAPEDRLRLHHEVPKLGLSAQLAGRPILGIAEQLVALASGGLAKQAPAKKGRNESLFLKRIEDQILRPGKSPADKLLAAWQPSFQNDPRPLIESLSIG